MLLAELREDRGAGDITSHISVPPDTRARARLVGRAPGILAGLDGFARAFELAAEHQLDGGEPGLAPVILNASDGDSVAPDQVLSSITRRGTAETCTPPKTTGTPRRPFSSRAARRAQV